MLSRVLFLLNILTVGKILAIRINITNFDNCDDHEGIGKHNTHAVLLKDIQLDYIDRLCDTVHGSYTINTVNPADKKLVLTLYHCRTGTSGMCFENREEYTEVLHCKRFQTDQSGPWFMIADAMSGSKCGQTSGEFKLENARLKPEYLTKYMKHDKDYSRHRMQMLFLKKGNTEADEDIVRGCINVEFDVIF